MIEGGDGGRLGEYFNVVQIPSSQPAPPKKNPHSPPALRRPTTISSLILQFIVIPTYPSLDVPSQIQKRCSQKEYLGEVRSAGVA